MTNYNGFAYFQDAMVSRKNTMYVVDLEVEEAKFYLGEKMIDEIARKTGEDKNLIAILIAYIDYVRKSRGKRNGKHDGGIQNLPYEDIVDGVTALLRKISIDDLIEKIKGLKWHEIKSVLTGELPIEEII